MFISFLFSISYLVDIFNFSREFLKKVTKRLIGKNFIICDWEKIFKLNYSIFDEKVQSLSQRLSQASERFISQP